jgi:hypothetical protein
MKKVPVRMAGVLITIALAFPCASCTKKGDEVTSTTKKEARTMTPEQSKQREEIRKGIEESKNMVVARVNGVDITMHALVKEMNANAPKIVPQGQPATPEMTEKVKRKSLNDLIFKELAVQEALQQGMSVKPEVVEEVITKVKAQAGSEEAYRKYLEERGLNEDTLRRSIEKSHLLEMITAREIYGKIKVDDKALSDAYEKEKASFMTRDNPPRQLSFEEVKDFLVRKIKAEKGEKLIAKWNNELRKKAKIEIMPDKVK